LTATLKSPPVHNYWKNLHTKKERKTVKDAWNEEQSFDLKILMVNGWAETEWKHKAVCYIETRKI
jgi:hypothetical protein